MTAYQLFNVKFSYTSDQTNFVNEGFIIWLSEKCLLRDMVGSPEWARYLYLALSGSQFKCRIWFILPAHGANHTT